MLSLLFVSAVLSLVPAQELSLFTTSTSDRLVDYQSLKYDSDLGKVSLDSAEPLKLNLVNGTITIVSTTPSIKYLGIRNNVTGEIGAVSQPQDLWSIDGRTLLYNKWESYILCPSDGKYGLYFGGTTNYPSAPCRDGVSVSVQASGPAFENADPSATDVDRIDSQRVPAGGTYGYNGYNDGVGTNYGGSAYNDNYAGYGYGNYRNDMT